MRWIFGLWLIAFASFAGCVDEASHSVSLGSPSVGDRFHYEGSDGSSLTITVLGEAKRSDGQQRLHDTVVLAYLLRPAGSPAKILPMEEAVALSSGHHVRHDVFCVDLHREECPDFHEVFFGAQGIAGALGAAPFWGKALKSGAVKIPGEHGHVDTTAKREPAGGRDCLRIQTAMADAGRPLPWMPITSAFQPRLICNGDILPTQWRPDRPMLPGHSDQLRPTFTLIERTKVAIDGAPEGSDVPHSLVRNTSSGPEAILTSSETLSRFSAKTAHQKALELDDDYRTFFTSGSDTAAIYAEYQSGGTTVLLGNPTEERSSWILRLAKPTGEAYQARIEQRITHETLGGSSRSYAIIESSILGEEVTYPRDDDAFTGYDASVAYEYGRLLFEADPNGAYQTFLGRERFNSAERVPLHDRFITRTFYEPPGACPDHGGCVYTPWIVEAESNEGLITYLRIPDDMRFKV